MLKKSIGSAKKSPSFAPSSFTSSSAEVGETELEARLDALLENALSGDSIRVRNFRSRPDLVPKATAGQRKSFRARSFGECKDDENRESKLQRSFAQTQGDATCFGFTICSCVGQKTPTTLVDDDEKKDEEKPLFECELWLSRGRESEESGPPGSWNVVCKDASDGNNTPLFMLTLKEDSTLEELFDRHAMKRPFPTMVVRSLLGVSVAGVKKNSNSKTLQNSPTFAAAKMYKGNAQVAEIIPLQRDFPKAKLVGKVERMNSMLIRRDENDALGTRLVPYTRGLRSLLYTMIGTGLMTIGFAVPITYSSVKTYEMPVEIHENGLEGLNGMRDKEVRNFRDKCAAFVKPIGTIRVKKAGLGHFKLKREENQEYNEWPKHTKRHFLYAMVAHAAMVNEFAKDGTYSIPDTAEVEI